MIATVTKLLAPLRTRIANLVSRAVVQLVKDSTGLQVMQVSALDGETREALERFQEYGFTSVPLAGSEAVVLFVGGRRDHGLVLAVDDRRYRKQSLEAGEVALYHKDGASILLKSDGSIEVTPKSGQNVILSGGTKQIALADHTHGPGTFAAGGDPVTGISGSSSSNTSKVKAG
jgi:phage baseplate assembly protein V